MFEKIAKVDDLNCLYSNVSFSYQCFSEKCSIGKDIWLQYYKNINQGEGIFTISDSILMMGGIATIMIYVENADKTYKVYRYSGELIIDRRIVKNIRHDILVNIDYIINELIVFLKSTGHN